MSKPQGSYLDKDLVRIVAHKSGFTHKATKKVMDNLKETICELLVAEKRVVLFSLGTFSISLHKGKKGYSPTTGQYYDIPEMFCVKFVTSLTLKRKIREITQ